MSIPSSIRVLRFHQFGEPADVLQLEQASVPTPSPARILVRVEACGLNPADWALCRGLFPGSLPRGIGLEVSGTVEAMGEGVEDVAVGDAVLGAADYAGAPSAGAAELAVLNHWAVRPAGLDAVQAAALPMAVETAYRSLDQLGVSGEQTLLVHGAGTTVGFAAVQIARARGARVLATAGPTLSERLRQAGAEVTTYGDGMVERVLALGTPALVLDTAPPSGALPDLVRIAGNPRRVLTISDFAAARELGCRDTFGEHDADAVREGKVDLEASTTLRYDVLAQFARMAAEGLFTVPVARTFPLDEWRAAMEISLSGHAHGKLVLLP